MSDYTNDLAIPDIDDDPTGPGSNSSGKVSAGQQGGNIPAGWKPTAAEPVPVVRCTARIRNGPRIGEQCTKWSIRGATVCLQHGGNLPNLRAHANSVVESARMRLIGLADDAIDTLEDLVQPGTAEAIRLAAAKEILDRSGIVKGQADLNVVIENKRPASEIVAEKLAQMAARMGTPDDMGEQEDEIVDADE